MLLVIFSVSERSRQILGKLFWVADGLVVGTCMYDLICFKIHFMFTELVFRVYTSPHCLFPSSAAPTVSPGGPS